VLAGAVVAGALFWTLGTRIGIVSERDSQWLREAGGGRLGRRVGAFTARFVTRD
jgi:hypothetical protein